VENGGELHGKAGEDDQRERRVELGMKEDSLMNCTLSAGRNADPPEMMTARIEKGEISAQTVGL
jgi:hypothetical protein